MILGLRPVKSGVMKPAHDDPAALAGKIARLVQERGWNQEKFAREARVNRLTAALPYVGPAIAHLRDVLGEASYETLARKGATMTAAELVNFAYDQIDQARAELTAVSE